jgi:hypothetical protein
MIRIYDNTLTQLGVINNYTVFQFKRELRNKGQFTLKIAKNKTNTEYLQVGNIIAKDAETSGIIVDRVVKQTKDGQMLEIKGTSLLGILNYRITKAYTNTGATETIAKDIVDTNLINATDTDRNVSILSITTDGLNGTSQNFDSTNEPLLKALEKLLSVDDYGHKITLDGTELTYDVIVPVDRTDSVQFSNKIFNLDEATRTQSNSNYKTFVYFEGTTVTGTYGTDTGLNRIEVFVKDSSTDNTTDRSKQELNGRYYKTDAIDGKIRIVGNPFKYKTDYDLGDYVTVIFDNEVFEVQITEATETYDNNGFRLDLTFGTPRRDFADMITDIRESEK